MVFTSVPLSLLRKENALKLVQGNVAARV